MQRSAHSMTGVGLAAGPSEVGELRIEVRSVNGRTLSVKVRAPSSLPGYEAAIEAAVRDEVHRGSVVVIVERVAVTAALPDPAVLRAVTAELRRLALELGLAAPDLSHVLQAAGVVGRAETSTSRPLPPKFAALLADALRAFMTHRQADGAATLAAIEADLAAFAALRSAAADRAPQLVEAYRQRLAEKVREYVLAHVPGPPPALDLVREIATYSDRIDVEEELQRLAAHVVEFQKVLTLGGGIGRRLEFLLQELLRETNTLGSKSPDAPMAHTVVAMKTCIERMKEQVQNLE